MARDESVVRALAAARHGIVSWPEAREAGFTSRTIARRVSQGAWARVGHVIIVRDLYVPGDAATAWLLHLHSGTDTVVSGPLAVRLQRWEALGSDNILLSDRHIRAPAGYTVRYMKRHPGRIVRRAGLPPMAHRQEALMDTLVWRGWSGARDLLDRALQRRWVSSADLEQAIAARRGPGPRGLRRLDALRRRATTGSRSEAEQIMGRLLQRTPGSWIANFVVHGNDGSILAEIDFADPELRLAVEVDGRAFHTETADFERDRIRQNLLVLAGWTVLRFTWERITRDPDGVVREVAAARDALLAHGGLATGHFG